MKAYSLDLRQRVVRAVENGQSCRQAAKVFGVSDSTAVKWLKAWRETGSVAPKRFGPALGSKLDAEGAFLLALVEKTPDITLEEMRRALAGKGVRASVNTLWRFFDRRGITVKKRRGTPPSRSAKTSPPRAAPGKRRSRSSTPIS